jgi:large repetitive protein
VLANGTEQLPYNATLTAPGSLQTPQFTIATGSLPAGMTLSTAGLLSGTPTATGTFNFTVAGSDPSIASCAFNRAFTLEILVRDIFENGFE